ncbi:MAG: glycosyltransferase, partial [Bilophila wadsworthia]
MCGGGLLYLKERAPARHGLTTRDMLGRSMAGSVDIYKQMNQINPKLEAGAYNITAKCSMETASAREADCFTTVSRITADEATVFLGRSPDVVTPNGLDMRVIPDYSAERDVPVGARAKLLGAAGRLLRRELAPDTRIFIISGRYEYHNKGVDVFLDALAGVNEALRQSQTTCRLVRVMGRHSGSSDAVGGDPSKISDQGRTISSHHDNQPQDPILNACKRLGLDNRPENHVQVIFDPALLDGNDGFLNMPYEEVLAACDLGVFPSWYEPWGYTPQESAAHAVPTVTTDLSGFGLWVRDTQGQEQGVTILHRQQTSYEG